MPDTPRFEAGRNIAMKVPPHQYDATVHFYRDTLGFQTLDAYAPDIVFEFGGKNLWIDNTPGMSQAEIWLEVTTDDVDLAADALAADAVIRCDAIEPLPDDLHAFWVTNPAAIIHLVCQDSQSPG